MYMGRVNGAAVLYIIHEISARINKYLYSHRSEDVACNQSPDIAGCVNRRMVTTKKSVQVSVRRLHIYTFLWNITYLYNL